MEDVIFELRGVQFSSTDVAEMICAIAKMDMILKVIEESSNHSLKVAAAKCRAVYLTTGP